MKIAVTGATGYLGGRLVEKLRSRSHEVRLVSRSLGHDIRRPETLQDVFKGADAVFHLAALVQSRPGPFEETNVEGLRNVLETCAAVSAKRVVCVSSFTIFGPSRGMPHREESASERQRFFHGYDRTKYQGYLLAQEWKERLPMNIAFPAVVYGPGALTEGNIMARLFRRWLRFRFAGLPNGGRPSWNFVYVEDAAEGLARMLDAPSGEDFILGGENASLKRLCKTFAKIAGVPIAPLGLPSFLFKVGAVAEDLASRIGGFPPLVLPSTADFFLNDWEFSSDKARKMLGYSPRALETGLESTYRWMEETGLP